MSKEEWVCGDCNKQVSADLDTCPTASWIHDLALQKYNQGRIRAEEQAREQIKEIVTAIQILSKHNLLNG